MISYLQQLEILAFFSGYPLLYAIVATIGNAAKSRSSFRYIIFMLLPFAYAIVGILYTGLQLKNLYPDYSFKHIYAEIQIPFYAIWGLLSITFFIPALSKRPVVSLLHSLVFFYLMVRNFYLQLRSPFPDHDIMKNHMRIYFDSIILNIVVIISLSIFYYIIKLMKKKAFVDN